MPKKLTDIKNEKRGREINLRAESKKKKKSVPLEGNRSKNIILKKAPITEVSDLKGSKKANFLYIQGRKFNPPQFLGNLLKVSIFGFFIILVINSINAYYEGEALKQAVSESAYEGYSKLVAAGHDATRIQFDDALQAFDDALKNFSGAQEKLWFINTDHTFYAGDRGRTNSAFSLLEGGKHFSLAGTYFLEALDEFNKIPVYFVSHNSGTPEDNGEKPSITDTIKKGLEKTDLAIEQIALATEKMDDISEKDLPADVALRFQFARQKIEEIQGTLQSTASYFPALLKLLGDRYPHRYLVILQNNNEIRPTGGFIGSYAIVDVNEGYIEKLEVHDVYDLDGSFRGQIDPPEELKNFTSNWRLRDSNYHPDFPISAAQVKWFVEKEGGPSVDTIVAINQGLLTDLLEISGPVQVGNFGKLNSQNYNLLLSYVIEGKIWGEEDPKHILKVFIPAFKDAILQEKNIGKLSSKLYKAVQQKHIMAWSDDEQIEGFFDAVGLSGRMSLPAEKEDYLSVIHAATGGTKSEQFMEEEIEHDTTISEDGEVIDEVSIERSHLWNNDIYYQWKRILNQYGFSEMPDALIDLLGRGENKVSTRVYVPAGSTLIEASRDVQVKEDTATGKTYFFFDMAASAGGISQITIKYKLPFTLDFDPADTYKLIIQKQPGSRGSLLTKRLSVDEDLNNIGRYPVETRFDQNGGFIYATNLVYDRYFSAIFAE